MCIGNTYSITAPAALAPYLLGCKAEPKMHAGPNMALAHYWAARELERQLAEQGRVIIGYGDVIDGTNCVYQAMECA